MHCPKNKAHFQKYRGGSPREGKFSGNSWKLGIISSDYWESFPSGDFLPNTLGNLLRFWDSVMGPEDFLAFSMPGWFFTTGFWVKMPQAFLNCTDLKRNLVYFLTVYSFDTVPLIFVFTEAFS